MHALVQTQTNTILVIRKLCVCEFSISEPCILCFVVVVVVFQSEQAACTVMDIVENAMPNIVKRYLATLTFKERVSDCNIHVHKVLPLGDGNLSLLTSCHVHQLTVEKCGHFSLNSDMVVVSAVVWGDRVVADDWILLYQ